MSGLSLPELREAPRKERPILFSAPMVRAILEGRKTVTRRIVKPRHPIEHIGPRGTADDPSEWGYFFDGPDHNGYMVLGRGFDERHDHGRVSIPCPYGQPGDRLVVKEAAWMWCERRPNGTTKTGRQKWHYVPLQSAPVIYCADHPEKPGTSVVSPDTGNQWGWRKKLGRFLPKWASRITLEVTGVRVDPSLWVWVVEFKRVEVPHV